MVFGLEELKNLNNLNGELRIMIEWPKNVSQLAKQSRRGKIFI